MQGDDSALKKNDELSADKKGESMADWGRRTAVTLALTFLTSSQGLLIAASKSKHVKYDYSVTSANCTVRQGLMGRTNRSSACHWRHVGPSESAFPTHSTHALRIRATRLFAARRWSS